MSLEGHATVSSIGGSSCLGVQSQLILPLIRFPERDSSMISLKASETLEHIARLEKGHGRLRAAGAIQIATQALGTRPQGLSVNRHVCALKRS